MGIETLEQDYHNKEGKASLPMMHVSLDLTYRCNHRCNMCFLYGDHLRKYNPVLETIYCRKEISVEQWKNTIAEIKNIGVRNVVMSGGEAFLKKGLLDLIEFAKSLGLHVTVLSNGSMITDDIARKVVSISTDFIRFSLDGDRPTHDKICGVPNFDILMATIDRICHEKSLQNSVKPELGFESVIQRANQDKLHCVIEAAIDKHVTHVTMSNVFFVPEKENKLSQETRDIDSKLYSVDVDVLDRELSQVRALAQRHKIKFYCRIRGREDIINIYHNPEFSYLNKCLYPWLMCRINPYGDVIPCTGSTLKLGNVLDQSLEEIWNGELYCKFRKDIRRAGLFPECRKCNTLENERWEFWNHINVD